MATSLLVEGVILVAVGLKFCEPLGVEILCVEE